MTSALFDRGASRYDVLVGLNPGYHAELRRAAQALAGRATHHSTQRLIDLACGSGASTRALLDAAGGDVEVLGLDASAGMLAAATAKDWPEGTTFAQATAGELDVAAFDPGSWDGIQAAYLYRNVPEAARDRALAEAWQLLTPGGWLVIIPLGLLLDHNFSLYRYLWRSVLDFDSVQAFGDRLTAAGFVDIARQGAGGWQQGILHTFVARKPL